MLVPSTPNQNFQKCFKNLELEKLKKVGVWGCGIFAGKTCFFLQIHPKFQNLQ
jgi:hypothetical protein